MIRHLTSKDAHKDLINTYLWIICVNSIMPDPQFVYLLMYMMGDVNGVFT